MVSDKSKPHLRCFKYRTGESALRCLVDGTLYFAKPAELNDMLETKFDHATPSDFNRVFLETLSEVRQKRGGAHIPINTQPSLAFIAENTAENRRFREACDGVGIFSAARRPNDQAMWAYYAENSQGFCFELEWSPAVVRTNQLFPVDVTYSGSARLHNRAEDWRQLFIALAEEHPNASFLELHQISMGEEFRRRFGLLSTARVTSVKHTDWKHERELRLIAPRAGTRPVLSSVLKRVHFIRTDGKLWGEVMQQINFNYPQVEVVRWEVDHGVVTMSPKRMVFRSIPIAH